MNEIRSLITLIFRSQNINNSGGELENAARSSRKAESWSRCTDRVNFRGGFLGCRVVAPIASISGKDFWVAGSLHRLRQFQRRLFGVPGRCTDRLNFRESFLGCRVVAVPPLIPTRSILNPPTSSIHSHIHHTHTYTYAL